MLLNFSVSGFSSINEEQELTFCAFDGQRIRGTKYSDNYVLSSINRPAKSTIIFGNNAVGKTNVLHALLGLKQVIVSGNPISNQRIFNRSSEIISFNIIVESIKNNSFIYDIAMNRQQQIVSERLVKNDQLIYAFYDNRVTSDILESKIRDIYSRESTSTLLSKLKDFIADEYREFLETISNIEILMEGLFNSDVKQFNITFKESDKLLITENKELALLILKQIDATIINIEFAQNSVDDNNDIHYDINIVRHDDYDKPIRFLLANESKGIKRIIYFLTHLLQVHLGKTIVIDELDASISAKSLILLFNNIINSPKNTKGQLIVTSHNLELFDLSLFAPQQIYIITKNKTLSSVINPLADYQLRSNKKRLAVEFLQGSFEVT